MNLFLIEQYTKIVVDKSRQWRKGVEDTEGDFWISPVVSQEPAGRGNRSQTVMQDILRCCKRDLSSTSTESNGGTS